MAEQGFENKVTDFLSANGVAYKCYQYDYAASKTSGLRGTANCAQALGADEHSIVKSLVFTDDHSSSFFVLMHGDWKVDATKLAACLDLTFATPCAIPVAQAQTGYLVGGTCPFVTKTKLKVYIEASLLSYEQVYINGGARGLILKMNPRDIVRMCQAQEVSVGEKSIINTRGKNTMDARGQKQKKKEKALSPEEIARVCELRRSQLDELEALESIFMEDGEFAVNDAMLIEEMTELLDEYEDDPDSAEGASAGKRVCEMPVIRFRIRLVLAVNMNRNGEGDSSDTEEAGVDADDLSKGPEADVDLHVCVLFPLAYPEEEAARITIDSEDYSGRLRKLRLIKALQDQATQMKGDECIYEVVNWLQNDDMITRFIHKRNKFGHYTKRMLYDEDNEDDDQDGVAGLAASLEDADIVDEGKNGRSADGSGNGKDKNKDNGEGEGADLDFSAMFEEGELAMLGKEKTRIKIGLVGLPNIGKSSLFNLMSGLQVPAEAYPFCTIDCNKAVVAVPDERLSHLVDLINPTRHVPPVVEILDIAGLVKGASEGYGLGNAFLHHISTVHVIFHLVRAFPDPSVEHVEGDLDPVRDLKIITHELILKDMERMDARIAKLTKRHHFLGLVREKERQEQVAVLRKARAWLATGRQLRYCRWTPSEVKFLSTQQMWTSKPVIVLVNMGKGDYHSYMRRHAGGDKGNNDDHTDHGHSHHENNENNENNEDNEDNEKSNSTRSAGVDKAGHSNDQYHDGRGACRVDEKMRKNARDHNNRTSINTDHDDKAKGKAPKTKLVKRTAPAKLDAIMQEVQHWVDCNSMGSTVIPFSAAAESKLFDEYKKSDDGKEAAGGSRENGGDDGDLGGDCVSSSTSPAPLSSGYAGDTKAGCDDDNTAGDVVSKSKSRSSLLTHHPSSKLPKMIHAGYQAASLIHFFTVNTEVVRAWTIRKGTKAPRAARKMHYDLDKRFISTEVYNYLELLQYGRVQELKAAGKLRMQGKEYVVEDGDILRFKFHQSSKK